jgi:TRAP transporter TAXI family solute receptor
MTRALFAAIALCTLAACAQEPPYPPRTDIRIGTAFQGGSWDLVGRALADVYTRELPHALATVTTTDDLEAHVDALEDGRLELAVEDAETAYLAFATGTRQMKRPHRNLRAISVLFSTAVQLVARHDAGITSVADLKGKKVVVGQKGGSIERAARLILESHGVPWDAVDRVPTVERPAVALREGTVDAQFIYAPFQNPLIAQLVADGAAHLVALDPRHIGAIQERHHFLKSTTIPRGTYKNLDEDVLTVGMDVLLLCRADLPEPLVYQLATTLFDAVPQLTRAHASAAGIDPDRGPTAAIPLHPGAARYYRAREILR